MQNSLLRTVLQETKIKNAAAVAGASDALQATKARTLDPKNQKGRFVRLITPNFDTSVWKANVVANTIKGLSLKQAKVQLSMNPKKPARYLHDLLEKFNKGDRFEIRRVWVGKGVTFKDTRIHARGRIGRMRHPFSHINVELERVPDNVKMSSDPRGFRTKSEFEKIW